MKKRGMLEQKQDDAMMQRIQSRIGTKKQADLPGGTNVEASGASTTTTTQYVSRGDLAMQQEDSAILAKMQKKIKTRAIQQESKESDAERNVMERLHQRMGHSTDGADKVGANGNGDNDAAEEDDTTDPVLSKLRTKLSRSRPSKEQREKEAEDEVHRRLLRRVPHSSDSPSADAANDKSQELRLQRLTDDDEEEDSTESSSDGGPSTSSGSESSDSDWGL